MNKTYGKKRRPEAFSDDETDTQAPSTATHAPQQTTPKPTPESKEERERKSSKHKITKNVNIQAKQIQTTQSTASNGSKKTRQNKQSPQQTCYWESLFGNMQQHTPVLCETNDSDSAEENHTWVDFSTIITDVSENVPQKKSSVETRSHIRTYDGERTYLVEVEKS